MLGLCKGFCLSSTDIESKYVDLNSGTLGRTSDKVKQKSLRLQSKLELRWDSEAKTNSVCRQWRSYWPEIKQVDKKLSLKTQKIVTQFCDVFLFHPTQEHTVQNYLYFLERTSIQHWPQISKISYVYHVFHYNPLMGDLILEKRIIMQIIKKKFYEFLYGKHI